MEPRKPPARKGGQQPRLPDPERHSLLSVRSALVLSLALTVALLGAGLLYEAHRPVPLIVLGAVGIFAAALKLLDSMIELNPELSICFAAAAAPYETKAPHRPAAAAQMTVSFSACRCGCWPSTHGS